VNAVIKPLCDVKKQELRLDVQAVPEVVPMMDILRMNQIFFNLFSNAVKFTPEGGTITYRLREKLEAADRLRMDAEVIDNGIGMSEAFLKTAFEPFVQGERSDTTPNRGTGLGLAIVRSLMELMGGTVTVTSAPGKGSAFHLSAAFDCIPAEDADQGAKAGRCPEASLQVLAGRRVLLCEDHPMNQEIAKTLLERKKMLVDVAENGQIAVRRFAASAPAWYDLILMDIRMPVMDGLTAAKEIRGLDRADAKQIPIIAMSADAFEEDRRKSRDAGMNGHLSKPVDPEQLYEELASCLRKPENMR